MRRRLLGMIVLLLVTVGIAGLILGGGSSSQVGLFASACVRAGTVLGALWLAFPRLEEISQRIPPQLLGALLLGILVVAVRPSLFRIIAPLMVILLAFSWLGTVFKKKR